MKLSNLFLVVALAFTSSLSAQTTDRFDGNWVVTWDGKSALLEAKLEIAQDKGTWQTYSRQKNDPCVGREVPIRVDERTESSLKMTLRFSEVIPGCKDAKVSLVAAQDGSISGVRGNAELKVTRAK